MKVKFLIIVCIGLMASSCAETTRPPVVCSSAKVAEKTLGDNVVVAPGGKTLSHSLLLGEIIKSQEWPELKSTTEGILFQNVIEGVNAIGWSPMVSDTVPAQESATYFYSTDGKSPQAIYFATLKGINAIENFRVPRLNGLQDYQHDSSMLNPATGGIVGLSKPAHIAAMRVNGGTSGASVHFIADGVKVLEGTGDLTLDPSEIIANVITAATKDTPDAKKITSDLETNLSKFKENLKTTKPADMASLTPEVKRRHGFQPSWDQYRKELRVLFYTQLVHHYEVQIKNPSPLAGTFGCNAPMGADCAPMFNPEFIAKHYYYVAEFARTQTFDKDGQVVSSKSFPVRASYQEEDPGYARIVSTSSNNDDSKNIFHDGDDAFGLPWVDGKACY